MTARSITNNNPGNIRLTGTQWDGQISGSDSSFATFATPAHGVRAMTRTLETYQDRHNLGSVRELISRWAPPNENSTNDYVNFVAGQMGVNPDQHIDLSQNPNLQQSMIGAMIRMEGGPDAEEYFAPHLSNGIRMATGASPSNSYTPSSGPSRNPAEVLGADAPITSPSNQPDYSGDISWDRLENGTHMVQNTLDQYDNYIYNIELFMLDSRTTIDFLSNDGTGIATATGRWPTSDVKKVLIAATGETSEIMITDLDIESISYGQKTSVITNNALNLSFTLTQVGHGKIADALQDAALIAGYPNISIANFFLKIDFEGYVNGRHVTIPGTTKVIPFRLSKLTDITTTTDQRGTNAVLQGVVIRKMAVTSPDASTLQHAMSFEINQADVTASLTTFMNKLTTTINENHPTTNTNFMLSYNIEFSDDFRASFNDLSIGNDSISSIGTVSGRTAREGDPSRSTTSTATPTLDLNAGTNIFSVIKDMLINTESIKNALTAPETSFSDVVSIDTDYLPKENGYNIMNNSEGALITYRIGVKQLLIDQNNVNQIQKLMNVGEIISEMLRKSRMCKKYYYHYTGLNDQIIDFNVSFNQQLTKSYNDATTTYFDITEINAINEYYEILTDSEKDALATLRSDHATVSGDVENLERDIAQQRNALETQVKGELLQLARDVYTQVNRQNQIDAGRSIEDSNMSSHPLDGFDNANSILDSLEMALGDDGDLSGIEPDSELRSLYAASVENLTRLKDLITKLSAARTIQSERMSNLDFALTSIIGENISLSTDIVDLFSVGNNMEKLNLSDDFAIEDLDTDVRSALISDDLRPLINLSLSNGIRFRRLVIENLSNPAELRHASNRARFGVELARRKFMEAYQQDISMIEATMTIKGDPFWVENYKVNPQLQTNGNNVAADLPHDSSTVSGPNSVMIIANTTNGTDDNHNPIVKNLFRYIYVVKRIHSSFSNGLFTQTLNMNKFHLASMIDSMLPSETPLDNDGNDPIGPQ